MDRNFIVRKPPEGGWFVIGRRTYPCRVGETLKIADDNQKEMDDVKTLVKQGYLEETGTER